MVHLLQHSSAFLLAVDREQSFAAFFPDDTADPETLLNHADTAMYETKMSGGNGYNFWAP